MKLDENLQLRQFPSNLPVFIDTNIFLYAIGDHPSYGEVCNEFFDRVKDNEVKGVISIIVLNELVHKLMIGEIAEKENIRLPEVIRYVKRNREILKDLQAYKIVEDVRNNYNLEIADAKQKDLKLALKSMNEKLLFSNDALHLAVMKRKGITNIATKDSDFDTIKDIRVWNP